MSQGPPRMPAREDYLAMGVDPAVLDKIDAERAAAAANPRPRLPPPPREEPSKTGAYFVLEMAEDHEKAACRFMDQGFEAGIYEHAYGSEEGGYLLYRPSDLWTFAWCLFGTRHMVMIAPWVPRVPASFKSISPPCSMAAIMLFGAKPAKDRELAEHSATVFCREALQLARSRYRAGFYADPFTRNPTVRP